MDIWGVNVLSVLRNWLAFFLKALFDLKFLGETICDGADGILYIHSLSPLLCPSWMPYICTTSTNIRLLMPTLPTHPLCPCKSPVLTVCV